MRRLFTVGTAQPKGAKSLAHKVLTMVLHLAPARESGWNVCPKHTKGCAGCCLHFQGRSGILVAGETSNAIRDARLERTRLLFTQRRWFHARLQIEIASSYRRLPRGWELAIRPNGTSDLVRFAGDVAAPWRERSRIHFYDYTKVPSALSFADGVHRTFSRSESNEPACLSRLWEGGNVAVVFDTPRHGVLPATWHGYRVIDGDVTDLRYRDPSNVIVGLRAKGTARRDTTGFVVRTEGRSTL